MKPEAEIPILIGADTPLNVRMTGEIADGLITLHTVPKQVKEVQALIGEGLAKRKDDKTIKAFQIVSGVQIAVTEDVKATIEKAKRGIALYAGGFGARDINFHKDAMAKRGYQQEADRIQELFLAGRRDEAAKAVPDDYVDEEMLIGPTARIQERFKTWRDSGFTTLNIRTGRLDVLELIAKTNDA
jgi:alkanesulfonate monooxygenase SsuD/methylene tetrahydromethanopterin reductase-like flavin-dependent oxidoreductase (luciferase family)